MVRTALVPSLALLLSSGFLLAQAPKPNQPGPEHRRLAYFAGTWNFRLEMKPSPFGPAGMAIVPSGHAAVRPTEIESQLMQLERDWSAAFLRHDVDAVSRILADDFIGIDGRGFMSNRQKELEEVRAQGGEWVVLYEALDDFKVRVYGEAAVVTARNTERIRAGGQERTVRFRRTTVWVRRDSRWRCVSFHGSRILEAGE